MSCENKHLSPAAWCRRVIVDEFNVEINHAISGHANHMVRRSGVTHREVRVLGGETSAADPQPRFGRCEQLTGPAF